MPTRRRSGSRAKAHAVGRQVRQPVVHARVRLGPMVAAVAGGDEARQPAVRLRLGFGLVEMVERLVRLFHGAERPLDLALGPCRGPPSVRSRRHVRQNLDAQAFHHALEHRRLRHRPVVEVERGRDALERVALALLGRRLGRHGVEQEAQRRLHVLAVHAAIFLIGDTRAVIHDGEQHQGGCALPVRVDPGRRLELLQVRGAHVEVPQRVRLLGLEADRGRLARHPLVVVAEALQVPVEGGCSQPARRELLEAVRGVHAVLHQQLQGPHRRKVAALLVGGPDLHGGDDLAPALDLGCRHRPWAAPVRPVRVPGTPVAAQQAIQRGAAHRVELRRGRHHRHTLGMARRQRRQAPPQGRKRLNRHSDTLGHHTPAVTGGEPRSGWGRSFAAALGRCVPSSTAWPAALGEPSPLT